MSGKMDFLSRFHPKNSDDPTFYIFYAHEMSRRQGILLFDVWVVN